MERPLSLILDFYSRVLNRSVVIGTGNEAAKGIIIITALQTETVHLRQKSGWGMGSLVL